MSETTAVAPDEPQSTSRYAMVIRRSAGLSEQEWTDEKIAAIKSTCCPAGTTNPQLAIFLATCARYGLNPMLREVWLADMKGRIMVVTGRDAFVKIMNNQADFRGLISGVVYSNDEFAIMRDGDRVIAKHQMVGMDRGKLTGAYAILRREGKPDQYITRKIGDFSHLMTKESWKLYPDDMVETRAIVAVARRGYNLAGLEEQTVAEDVLDRANRAASGSVEPSDAIAGTSRTADELRERLAGMSAGQSPPDGVDADGVVTVDVEVIEPAGRVTQEDEDEMEERIRLENLRLDEELAREEKSQ